MRKTTKFMVSILTSMILIAGLFGLCIEFDQVSATGPTVVSGIISINTTWPLVNSPYLVTENILIESGVDLIVEPGVEVKFKNDTYLKVEGSLTAQGTEDNNIDFTSNYIEPKTGTWGGIRIRPTAGTRFDNNGDYLSGSVLDHVNIEYADTGIYIYNTEFLITHSSFMFNNNAIKIQTTNHTVFKNNTFINNNNGIWSTIDSDNGDIAHQVIDTYIQNNMFLNNSYGLKLNLNHIVKDLIIDNNEFSGNDLAIEIGTGGSRVHSVIMNNNWIHNNRAGISFPDLGRPVDEARLEYQVILQYNKIVNNTSDSLSIGDTQNARFLIDNNTLADNEGGIRFYGRQHANSVFKLNCVANNDYGIRIGGDGNSNPTQWQFFGNTFSRNSGDIFNIKSSKRIQINNNNFLMNDGFGIANYAISDLDSYDNDINATNNYWGTTLTSEINSMIYDYYDDFELSKVLFEHILKTINTEAPISPPSGVIVLASISTIELAWDHNPETDIAGYKVYYDTNSRHPYDGVGFNEGSSEIDIGNIVEYKLTGFNNKIAYFIAVTAYDSSGKESWYSTEVIVIEDYDEDGIRDNIDAFPYDNTQWLDYDGDMHGDNQSGTNPDAFPEEPTQWMDSDGDGYGDNVTGNNSDSFPNDPTQWTDTDGDGYGDNLSGDNPDSFPTDPTEWNDSDNDGIGDQSDAFPFDHSASIDADGDNYPDSWNEGMSGDNSTSGLQIDKYPNDPTKYKKEQEEQKSYFNILLLIAIILILVLIVILFIRFRR